MIKLNLGSGIDKKDGWTSIDFNLDYLPHVQWDLRKLPLPFEDASAELIYVGMTLSQLTPIEGQALLKDCARLLCPGGWIRIFCMDFEEWQRLWVADDKRYKKSEFTPAERHYYWSRRYKWELIYDRTTAIKYLTAAGFTNFRPTQRNESTIPNFRDWDVHRQGFIFEAQKPDA